MPRIYMSAPDVGELESRYVAAALASGWVAPAGPDLTAFEDEVALRTGVAHAVGVSSGTAGLHLGLIAAGVTADDVVLAPTMTFAATANAITYVGAEPVFIDCAREDGNIDVTLLAHAAEELRGRGRTVGAFVPVDLLGKCADMTAISALASDLHIPLVVDAAESMGATHHGRAAGSFGLASVLSFNGNKIMTTSGGGMLLTNERLIADRVRYLSTQARQPVVHYEHTEIGYNYRLSNILAALGRAQLVRLDSMITRRRGWRARYRTLFAGIEGVTIFGGDDAEDNCWLTSIVVDASVTGWSSEDLRAYLDSHDIESRPLWKPMHRQPVFASAQSFLTGNADWLFDRGLTLPSGSAMADADFGRVESQIADFLGC